MHLSQAIRLNPQVSRIYYKLIAVLDKMGKARKAFDWRRKLIKVDQMNVRLVDALLETGKAHGASKKDILKWGEMGNHVAPFSTRHHMVFAKVLKAYGLNKKATFEAQSVLLINPLHKGAKAFLGIR
jgi:hypothetical protein